MELQEAAGVLVLSLIVTRRSAITRHVAGLAPDRRTALRFAAGFALGGGMYLLHLTVAVTPADAKIGRTASATTTSVLIAVATYFALSCMEEVGFRGYTLRRLDRAFGFWPAQIISAVAFALTHLFYGWTLSTVLAGVLPCGLLFGMAAAALAIVHRRAAARS